MAKSSAVSVASSSKASPPPGSNADPAASEPAPTLHPNIPDAKRSTTASPLLKLGAGADLPNGKLLRWMFRFIKPVLPNVAEACFWLTLGIGAEVYSITLPARAVNLLKDMGFNAVFKLGGFSAWVNGSDAYANYLKWIVFTLAGLVALMFVVRYLREVANTQMSMNLVFYIREAVYDKMQRVGFGFHDAISSGQLINRALSDLQNVRQFIQTAILTTLEICLVIVGYIGVIASRNPWMALLALVPLPIWTWYILRFSKKVQPAARSTLEAEDRNVSLITENIAGVHVVKAFATEKQEIQKYDDNCQTFFSRKLKQIRLFADFQPVIRSIANASHLSLFVMCAIMIIKGKMLIGDFLILGTAMSQILTRLQAVGTINEQYQNAIVSSRRLYEVLMAPPTVPEKPAAKPLPAGLGNVVFENVTFGYAPNKPVLHGLNFNVKGGSIVAIVGPTGAGKSSLVNLAARFYDPQHGRILIDGMDIRDASLSSIRTQVAFVFQETYLFSDTVAANISYGRPGVTIGDIEAAARLAQAHDFISELHRGYDTLLSERGSSLSGGQRQRLAIARAIVTNPRVLILDDATAAIDPETEDLIRRGMRHVMRDRTTFVIAHRISTVKQADMVLVLEHGRITQMGTHRKLMSEDGHYRDIAVAQLRGDDEPEVLEKVSHMDRVQQVGAIDEATQNIDKDIAAPEPSMGKG